MMTVQTRPGNVQPAEAGRADIGDVLVEVPPWTLSRLMGYRGLLRERSRLAAGLVMAVAAVWIAAESARGWRAMTWTRSATGPAAGRT